MCMLTAPVGFALLCLASSSAAQSWLSFTDETVERLGIPANQPALSTADDSERSYAFGDVDQDGDTDVVVARRPAYALGFRQNVLFMNEGLAEGHSINGVLVDRTAEYASASDVAGDSGFLTPTSNRDIILADVNNDSWLDVVTATAWSDGQPKHISHPRVYMNLGEERGVWQGFRFEDARIPQMHPTVGPRFASVSAGDVTGDGFVDLWFSDFDVSESPMTSDPFDYNNKLLVNNGAGHFADETAARLTAQMSNAAYGAAGAIADMNGDGVNDLVKQSSNLNPLHIAIIGNNPANVGSFSLYQVVYQAPLAGYYVSVGELNADGRMDLIVTDNNTDRYLLNNGSNPDGSVNLVQKQFPFVAFDFGGNSYAADLDNDAFNDVLITDMDVDVPGCSRRMHIYRNLGNVPDVDFVDVLDAVPTTMLTGTHDVAAFDINGDGRRDLMIGRCASTQVWINTPLCPPNIVNTGSSNNTVDVDDLVAVILQWGPCPAVCPANIVLTGASAHAVDVDDLVAVIVGWGPCR
jgi:hypothetical protein